MLCKFNGRRGIDCIGHRIVYRFIYPGECYTIYDHRPAELVSSRYPTVYGVQVDNALQMFKLDLLLLWTALLHPGTRSVPINFNQPDFWPLFEVKNC